MRNRHERNSTVLYLALLNSMLISTSYASAQSQRNNWGLSLSVNGTSEFDSTRNGAPFMDRNSAGANAGLSFATTTERATFGLFGRIGSNFYRDDLFEDQLTYGGGFNWSYRTGERSNMRLSQTVSKDLRLDTVSSLGIVPRDFESLSATTSWSFQQQSGPRTSWGTSLGYRFYQFENPGTIDGSQIVLDEQPFGDALTIPIIDPTDPGEVELPDGERDVLDIIATEGLAQPQSQSHDVFASLGLNHSIGQYTSIGFNVGAGYRTIDQRLDASFNQEGAVGNLQAFVQRSTSTSSALNVGYTYERSLVIDPDTAVQSLFGGWSYGSTSSSLRATVFGGASRYAAADVASTQPVANVSFSGNITSSTSAGIAYSRQFSMARGYGRSYLIDYASASLSQAFGTRVNAIAIVGISLASDPLDEETDLESRRAGGNVSVRIVGGLSAGTSYYYTENEQKTSFSDFEDIRNTWSLYLSFATNW